MSTTTEPAATPEEKPEAAAPEAPPPEAEIEKLKAEVSAMKDKMLRAVAEAENTRKRAQRDVEESSKYALSSFARDLVGVAENLQRALDSIPADARETSPTVKLISEGVEMTRDELLGVLARNGIKRIDPMGQKFDHNFHQAVVQLEVPGAEAGTVVQVVQAGYTIHDRLLRPALVGVAKQGETPKQVDTSA